VSPPHKFLMILINMLEMRMSLQKVLALQNLNFPQIEDVILHHVRKHWLGDCGVPVPFFKHSNQFTGIICIFAPPGGLQPFFDEFRRRVTGCW
jgi:hypothetical protein